MFTCSAGAAIVYYLCYLPWPLYFFQHRFLCLFLGRDRTESPIDVLFFTGSLYIPTLNCLAILSPWCFLLRLIIIVMVMVMMFFYQLLFLFPEHLH